MARSNFLQIFMVLISLSLPLLADEEGRLQSIDTKAYTLTISTGMVTQTFRYRPSLEVKLDGQPIRLDELTPGMMLKIKTSEKGVAARILASEPDSFDQKQFPGPMIMKGPGRVLTITGVIPGADAIKVQAGGIWWEHLSAMGHGMPAKITINGKEWIPTWTDRTSTKITFQPELAGFATADFTVEKVSGRSELKVEQPTAANDWTLTVTLIDGPVGSGAAEVRIKW